MIVYRNTKTNEILSEDGMLDWFSREYNDGEFYEDQEYFLEEEYNIVQVLTMSEDERAEVLQKMYDYVKGCVFDSLDYYNFVICEVIDK